MRNLSRKFFDIRQGEGLKASLMFSYIFLIIASLMIVKPVRNSLFLVSFGVERLPYVFVLMALFSASIAWLYSRFAKTIRLDHLISYTIVLSIASLFFFWSLLYFGHRGALLLYSFYIWVAIFGLITSTQFWLLANYVFNVREARRLFGFVGAGAISGGIFGGYLTNYLAPRINTENLIFFCIAFLTVCLVLSWLIWDTSAQQSYVERARKRRSVRRTDASDNPIKLIMNSRHLTLIMGIIGIGVVTADLVDYQFSAVASRMITDTDELTAFFGFWMSTLSILSLGIQLVLTGRVMKYFGVVASLFFLPLGILVGTVALLFNPGLGSAILVKVSDGSFKHSINKAGTELLSLPIPSDVKNRVKAFIDVFIDNLATGLAGALLILLTIVLHFSVYHISLIIIGLIGVWIYLVLSIKNEYVNSFRKAIEKRTIDLEQQSLNLEAVSVVKNLITTLEGDNERQILYVLDLLEGVQNKDLIPYIKRLVKHPSDEVKTRVLKMASVFDEIDLSVEANDLTGSGQEALRVEAIKYLCERSPDKLAVLKRFQEHENYHIRGSAMICAARAWKESKEMRGLIHLKNILDQVISDIEVLDDTVEEKKFIKINIARIIGIAGDPVLYPYLHSFLKDVSTEVVQAAVVSAGQTRAHEFVPVLIQHLKTKNIHRYARQALAEYGEQVIETLVGHIDDPAEDYRIRRRIPRVLALIGSQKSADILFEKLEHRDLSLRDESIKALNGLRVKFPTLRSNKSLIEERIVFETKRYYHTSIILYRLRNPRNENSSTAVVRRDRVDGKRARILLINALGERIDDYLERIFRLLGLRYLPEDMYNAYLGVTSRKSRLKAAAVEFLDNILKSELKRVIIPIVEYFPAPVTPGKAHELFNLDVPGEHECVTMLLCGDDNWLKSCTLYLVAKMNWRDHLDEVVTLIDDRNPMVREASIYCLEHVNRSH